MQEFRPAEIIDQDTLLAESLIDGDIEALGALVVRFGRAVEAVIAAAPEATRSEGSNDVFVQAWNERENIGPGSDFAPWIGGIAATVAGRPLDDVADTWAIAMAIDAVGADDRAVLRAHHVDGSELPEDADRHERRLRRRLSHLGSEADVVEALEDPQPWSEPAGDRFQRVRTRLGLEVVADDSRAEPRGAGGAGGGDDDRSKGDRVELDRPSRVTRSLRPVLLGLVGAVTVVFVAIVALSAASGSPDPVSFTADLTPTGAILDVEGGEVAVTERDSGLQIDLDAPTLPRRAGNLYYEAVLVVEDGSQLAVGTFNEGFGVTLSGGVSLDRVEEFLVVARELGTDVSDVVLKLDIPRN